MSEASLKRLYEDPATPLAVGADCQHRQAKLLAAYAAGRRGSRLRCVDVGCGDGATMLTALRMCADQGTPLDVVGLDWSATGLERCRKEGIVVGRASVVEPGLPLRTGSVDIVVMSEIIEHLVDTDAALAEAYRALSPGGLILVSTPNLAAWYNRILLATGTQPVFTEVSLKGIYGRPGSEVAGHLRIFTRRALAGLLAANGFESAEFTGAQFEDVPRGAKWLDRLLCRTPSLASILLATARKPPDRR
ncbi:MAG TPA: class I SAM-dependent methyltransferase [Acidimicrobiales bacterium]|nr:class I SAM-dependent methyltransferase [Acidimicrobiales bacterium]